MTEALIADLRGLLGDAALGDASDPRFGHDATEAQGLSGRPDAVVLPADAEEARKALAWCYEHDVAIVPRGGGSGFSGGAVPVGGGVVIALDRMTRVRSFDPLLWRMQAEAGLRTSEVRRLARENGLFFPPDPGAAEQSQLGGNIATNAGGPHAFKYGVTGNWVTGLEAIVPPGELIEVGGPLRKDVAGYDLRALLVGSEGTLGIVTAAWLRLIPAPARSAPVAAFYPSVAAGCAAIETILGSGIEAAAIEYLDAGTIAAARGAYPYAVPLDAAMLVIAEADGTEAAAEALAAELVETMSAGSIALDTPGAGAETEALWRWRDGVSIAVEAVRGGKVSEDIAVPLDRLAEAIEGTGAIASAHGLESCSWGHAGDGNLHSTFLVDRADPAAIERAGAAAADLFAMAGRLGGTISGEHGLGWVKRDHLGEQWNDATLDLHRRVKRAIDPKNLMNPGKKT